MDAIKEAMIRAEDRGDNEPNVNEWQPMIDRCASLSEKIDAVLTRRAAIATSYDALTIHNIDDLETILFALRHTKHRLENNA